MIRFSELSKKAQLKAIADKIDQLKKAGDPTDLTIEYVRAVLVTMDDSIAYLSTGEIDNCEGLYVRYVGSLDGYCYYYFFDNNLFVLIDDCWSISYHAKPFESLGFKRCEL